jgi:hypothetical protein
MFCVLRFFKSIILFMKYRKILHNFLFLSSLLFVGLFFSPHVFADNGQSGTTLSATKTATGHFTRTFDWTIDKSVTPDTWNLFNGDTGTSQYTVSVTKDSGTDSVYVDGQVCVTNGGSVATENLSITDVIQDKIGAGQFQDYLSTPLDLSAKPILNAGESYCYSYSIPFTPIANTQYRNVAEITITNHSGSLGTPFGPDPKADFTISDTPTIINNSITVDDTNGQQWTFTDSGSQSYDKTFSCGADAGKHDNTATIEETGQSSSASVTVNCYDPTVTKTAATKFSRSYNWNLQKTGDQANLTLALNENFLVNYTVTASATVTDFNWQATGTITVHNPAPIAATINSMSDVMTGGNTATVDCGPAVFPYTLDANSDLVCSYSGLLPDATTRTNTATATQQNYSYDKDGNATATGTTDYHGTASVDFSNATITEIDKCITVSDDKLGTNLGTLCYGVDTLPHTYTYQLTIGGYATCGLRTFTNTASFTTNDTATTGQSGWTVNVNVPCNVGCTLTIGYWKTHDGFGPQRNMVSSLLPIWLGNQTLLIFNPKSINVTTSLIAYNILTMNGTYGTPSNGITKLYAQLLAAKLNIKDGATGTAVASIITNADNFLSNKNWQDWGSLTKTQQNLVLSWMSALDSFNNGTTGPGHCSL